MSDVLRNILLTLILVVLVALGFVAGDVYQTQLKILAVLSGGCL